MACIVTATWTRLMDSCGVVILDSITQADHLCKDAVIVAASHGGLYAAWLAAQSQPRAVILNDAGIGYERAGVAGVEALADFGIAAAAVEAQTCCIGQGADMYARGRISVPNRRARDLGVVSGQAVAEAARLMRAARPGDASRFGISESRRSFAMAPGQDVLLIDSLSLLRPDDAGRIVITGSHGGLLGGRADAVPPVPTQLIVFNDAGFGADRAGVSRLFYLQDSGLAALTVSHLSARIGDAASQLETGVISSVNDRARVSGFVPGKRLCDALISTAARVSRA